MLEIDSYEAGIAVVQYNVFTTGGAEIIAGDLKGRFRTKTYF